MSKSIKRKNSADFKAKVALEAIRERKILIKLSQEFEIHPTQIKRWN